MVLTRFALALVALGACSKSLFDQHPPPGGDDDDTGGDGGLVSSCPSPCVADAGNDFGVAGKGWRYVEDTRNRAWVAMMASGNTAVGTDDPKNIITACKDDSSAPACAMLPGAMLVSSSGSTSAADPAAEWTSGTNQVITLDLSALVASSDPAQVIRLYRNSREDVLATVTAMPGTVATASVTLDAIANDRFLVAVAPSGGGATDVGVQLFASGAGTFPKTCELAVGFDGASGTSIANACGSQLTSMDSNTGASTVMLGSPPYIQLGQSLKLVQDKFVVGADVLDRTGDTTTQLWFQHIAVVDGGGAWVYSDYDLDNGGGLGLDVYDNGTGGLNLDSGSPTDGTGNDYAIATAPFPNDGAWHFIRAVHTGGKLLVCLDGSMVASEPLANLKTTYPPYMGQDVVWTPQGGYTDGFIDDVRVMSVALPCD